MLASTLVVALAFINGCSASLGKLRFVRPPSAAARSLGQHVQQQRSDLESIESGIINVGNSSSPPNAAIVPVVLSADEQTYYTTINTGNASYRVALDTGSADLWLISSACTEVLCQVPRYQLGYHSTTFVQVNNNQTVFNVSFADGTGASGFVALETVQISNLTVSRQPFGVVTSNTVNFKDDISGIVGLGFPRLSDIFAAMPNGTGTPFFATMAQRGQLEYPLFGLSLTRDASGSLTLGAVDGSVVTNVSLIQWNEVVPFAPRLGSTTNVSSYLQWTIPLASINVTSTRLTPLPTYPNATSNTSLALLDAGTAGIFGPFQDVSRIYSSIGGSRIVDESGQWVVPCDANETISFQFGGREFLMQPTDYLIGPTESTPDLCLSWPQAAPPSSDGIDWQLGTPFLRTVYSIFSYGIDTKEPPMIGLYPLRNASAPVETPEEVVSYFSSVSGTIATVLPNFLMPTPLPSAPPYIFNASIAAPAGEIVSSGLATSTYSPALLTHHVNPTAIPTVTPDPTLMTFIITTNGELITSVSTVAMMSTALGSPPGFTNGAAGALGVPLFTMLAGIVSACFFVI